jgi:hypothetical protein
MLWIVSGPSCAGKSTLLESERITFLTGLERNTPIIFPKYFQPQESGQLLDCFVHYNILRLCHLPPISKIQYGFFRCLFGYLKDKILGYNKSYWQHIKNKWQYRNDPAFCKIVDSSLPIKAIIIVVCKSILINRVANRKVIESKALYGRKTRQYPVEFWEGVYKRLDLYDIYTAWYEELSLAGIDCIFLDGSDFSYRRIDHESLTPSFVNL